MISDARRRSVLLVACAVGVLTVTAGCGQSAAESQAAPSAAAGAGDPLVFAAVPSENSQSLQSQYENLVSLLETELDTTVEFQNATDYAAVIEGQRAGKIDLAVYGPFSYKIAKDGGVPIEPIASGVTEKGGQPGYHSTAWTRPGSDITSIADLRGRKVCFVDPASTSGNLFPSGALLKAGIDPTRDLTQVFAGAHDASLIAVDTGQCEAGFAQDSQMPSLIEKGQLTEGQLTQIWTSDPIPGSPVALNTQTLDADTQSRIRSIFQEKANVDHLTASGICTGSECELPDDATWGYVPVTDETYAPIRQVCETTKAPACDSAD